MRTVLPLFRILTEQATGKADGLSSQAKEDFLQRRGLPMARAVSTVVEAFLDSAAGSLLDGIERMAAFKLTAEQWDELASHSRQVLNEMQQAATEKAKPLADAIGVAELVQKESDRTFEARVREIEARIGKEKARAGSRRGAFARDVIKVLAGTVIGILASRFV